MSWIDTIRGKFNWKGHPVKNWEYYEAQFKEAAAQKVDRELPQVVASNPGKDVKFDYDCHWFEVSDADGLVKVVHLGGREELRGSQAA